MKTKLIILNTFIVIAGFIIIAALIHSENRHLVKLYQLDEKFFQTQSELQMVKKQNAIILRELNSVKAFIKTFPDTRQVTVTGYSPEPRQTDSDPFITACMTKVNVGMVAVSRDLFYQHGWSCGKRVFIEGLGIFVINDVMHKRKRNQIDIFHFDTQKALKLGRNENVRAALLAI